MSGKHEVFPLLFDADKRNKRNQTRTKKRKNVIQEKMVWIIFM